jgi:hypothetical protein
LADEPHDARSIIAANTERGQAPLPVTRTPLVFVTGLVPRDAAIPAGLALVTNLTAAGEAGPRPPGRGACDRGWANSEKRSGDN